MPSESGAVLQPASPDAVRGLKLRATPDHGCQSKARDSINYPKTHDPAGVGQRAGARSEARESARERADLLLRFAQ
jgi:hypothetical protein